MGQGIRRSAVLGCLVLGGFGGLPAQAREPAGHPEDDPRPKSRTGDGARTVVAPYLEVAQVALVELSPGDEVLTYSAIAAGVDASIRGRNTQGQVSARYERRIGWGDDQADGDVVSGLARVSSRVIPGALAIDAGALAARTRVEPSGGASLDPLATGADAVSQVYALYAGPTLTTDVGPVALSAAYRIGYTRVETSGLGRLVPGGPTVDVFDDSVAQSATLSAGVRPGELGRFGATASAGWRREDIGNLDQRVDERYLREDVVIPVTLDLALLAGLGFEDVEVSSRDALRTAAGVPVIGGDGRFLADKAVPRRLGYAVNGLTWDAGVLWRPSRRTVLEAHVGKRYGGTSYHGSFAYAPNRRSTLNVSVHDNVAGFGGQVRRALEDLPTDFAVTRNPLSGDLNGCIIARAEGGCLNNALSSVASATFRARGIAASYGIDLGRIQAGLGAGYDRRKFLAAPGTVLAVANGVTDENRWASAWLAARIDERSSFNINLYANSFRSGFSSAGDANALSANASYSRSLTDRLTATAAVGVSGIDRKDSLVGRWTAAALVGLRYAL